MPLECWQSATSSYCALPECVQSLVQSVGVLAEPAAPLLYTARVQPEAGTPVSKPTRGQAVHVMPCQMLLYSSPNNDLNTHSHLIVNEYITTELHE